MPTHMNFLQIGQSPKDFEIPPGSLFISDDPRPIKGAKICSPTDGLNPLPLEYREAREFVAAAYPDKDLMTYRNGRRALTRLVMNADRLDRLHYTRKDDDQEAKGVVEDILLSPMLRAAFRKPLPRWVLSGGTTLVRINRQEIGDDDAKIAANVLMSQFKGQVVIQYFGFYAREHHAALIREERLIAGVNTLSELPDKLYDRAILMPKKGRGCTFEDAETLAKYAGHRPDPTRKDNPHNEFIDRAMAA